MARKEIRGVLDGYFETGTEGVLWAVVENGKAGYDALHILEDGDRLVVRDGRKAEFEGIIKLDRKVGWAEYPKNPGHGQQQALGMWVHGIQSGFEPDDWAGLFFRKRPLRATLTKRCKKKGIQ
jgi:hypothetical protein